MVTRRHYRQGALRIPAIRMSDLNTETVENADPSTEEWTEGSVGEVVTGPLSHPAVNFEALREEAARRLAAIRALGLPNIPLACVVCGRVLDPVFAEVMDDSGYIQPGDANTLTGRGTYGSTVFDPLDGSHVEVNICDKCLTGALASGRARISRACGRMSAGA
jgi:hypothetical protein